MPKIGNRPMLGTFLYLCGIKFQNMETFKKLRQLLELEQEEGLRQYKNLMLLTPLKQRREKGLTWYPIKINSQEIGSGESFYISLERLSHLNQNHAFQVGDSISLFQQSEKHQKIPSISGVIAAVWKNNMRIAFSIDELPEWINYDNLGVDVLFDTVSFREMDEALQKVMLAHGDRLYELRQILTGKQPAAFSPITSPEVFSLPRPQLNPSQNEALLNILAAKDVALVHGPPGTGKTTTLVEAVKLTLQNEKQVLVTAPSNTAVDLLTFKLLEKGLNVLRIGNPARFQEELGVISLEGQIAQHPDYKYLKKLRRDSEELHKMAGKYKRMFGREEREQRRLLYTEATRMREESRTLEKYIVDDLLKKTQVITATLVGAVNKYIRYKKFSTVFIDEAAQALEPATWIPISKAERVIFAGDHHQLPPTVKSYQAAQEGLSETLFEKVMQSQPQSATLLRTQYRMHEKIMGFSNQQFYGGKLIADESVRQHSLAQHPDDTVLSTAFEFIDTAGCSFEEKTNEETKSRYNPQEADLLLEHFAQFIAHLQITNPRLLEEDFSVGIVSPYQAQVEYLQNKIKTEYAELVAIVPNLSVHSVDGFQGQERDMMYISMVRSNEKGQIGFLGDQRRMNVALTRARKKLVVVGDSATLGQHGFYQDFLNYVEQRASYRSAWELMNP